MPPEAALADGCQELCAITDTSRFYRTKNVHCWPSTQRGWYPNRDKIDFGPARSHSAILTITCYLNNEFWLELAAVCAFEADRLTSLKGAGMLQHWLNSQTKDSSCQTEVYWGEMGRLLLTAKRSSGWHLLKKDGSKVNIIKTSLVSLIEQWMTVGFGLKG